MVLDTDAIVVKQAFLAQATRDLKSVLEGRNVVKKSSELVCQTVGSILYFKYVSDLRPDTSN